MGWRATKFEESFIKSVENVFPSTIAKSTVFSFIQHLQNIDSTILYVCIWVPDIGQAAATVHRRTGALASRHHHTGTNGKQTLRPRRQAVAATPPVVHRRMREQTAVVAVWRGRRSTPSDARNMLKAEAARQVVARRSFSRRWHDRPAACVGFSSTMSSCATADSPVPRARCCRVQAAASPKRLRWHRVELVGGALPVPSSMGRLPEREQHSSAGHGGECRTGR